MGRGSLFWRFDNASGRDGGNAVPVLSVDARDRSQPTRTETGLRDLRATTFLYPRMGGMQFGRIWWRGALGGGTRGGMGSIRVGCWWAHLEVLLGHLVDDLHAHLGRELAQHQQRARIDLLLRHREATTLKMQATLDAGYRILVSAGQRRASHYGRSAAHTAVDLKHRVVMAPTKRRNQAPNQHGCI